MFHLYQNSYQKRKEFRKLLKSEEWPQAIEEDLIHQDPTERGHAVLNLLVGPDLLPNATLLDFGCGSSQVAKLSHEYGVKQAIGYDIVPYPQVATNFQEVRDKGPYNIVVVNDVLDHLQKESAKQVMQKIISVLAPLGHILVRCHPYLSRTGTHLPHHGINKAYAHLVLPEITGDFTLFYLQPIQHYKEVFHENKLTIEYQLICRQEIENFFLEQEEINSFLTPESDIQYVEFFLHFKDQSKDF